MNQEHATPPGKDEMLWRIARKRAAFQRTLISYALVNGFLVAVWYFTDTYYFWPMWSMMGWGIGLAFQYANAYHGTDLFSAEKEYEKLKEESAGHRL